MTPEQLSEQLAAIYRLAAERIDAGKSLCACFAISSARQELRLPLSAHDHAHRLFCLAFKPPETPVFRQWFGAYEKENQQRRVLALLTMEQIALGNVMQPGEE
jgi:hypothetical protein